MERPNSWHQVHGHLLFLTAQPSLPSSGSSTQLFLGGICAHPQSEITWYFLYHVCELSLSWPQHGQKSQTKAFDAVSLKLEWSRVAKALQWSRIVKLTYLQGNAFCFYYLEPLNAIVADLFGASFYSFFFNYQSSLIIIILLLSLLFYNSKSWFCCLWPINTISLQPTFFLMVI